MRKWFIALVVLGLLMLVVAAPALAVTLSPPWNGQPVSPGIGPTYGEPWPVPVPTNEAVAALQGQPPANSTLAVMPYADIAAELQKFQSEAKAAGLPVRMTWSVTGKSAGGRDMYAVVINDRETAAQRRDYSRWQELRSIELTNPAYGKQLVADWKGNVKMPIYVEADINGNEYEGTDAMMQVIRDLTETPYGQNATVDKLLDHAILVVVPTSNPDGRVMGTRGNGGGPNNVPGVADTNRDYFSQSQPEEQIDSALQQEYLATGALHLHGYERPMLVDGDTKPLNPGTDAVNYYTWNTKRVTQGKADFAAAGMGLQSPVLDWNASGNFPTTYTIVAAPGGATESGTTVTITTTTACADPRNGQISAGYTVIIAGLAPGYNGTFVVTGTPTSSSFTYTATSSGLPASGGGTAVSPAGPSYAQTWDGWGPFYGQTYMEFLGVDSSTAEMDDSTADGGRLTAKTGQYLNFYSSANYWLDNRQAMMSDQLNMFLNGVQNAPTDMKAFADSPYLTSLGFTDYANNWMIQYPTAYIIPFGAGQRSDAEANRLVQWLLHNGVQVQVAKKAFTWNGTTYQAGSYIVSMSQALRGIAWNALAAGTDIESKITILYASPAAWSHGLLWGADTVEVPRGDTTFAPKTALVMAPNALTGGISGGIKAAASWYAVTLKGVHEDQAILGVLRKGIDGGMAQASFASTTGGTMPAGSLVFAANASTASALDAAGKQSGMVVQRGTGAQPPTTPVNEAPKVAMLVSSVPAPAGSNADSAGCLNILFGSDAQYVATITGANSLENSATDPLAGESVIYNIGASWPATVNIAASPNGAVETGNTVVITTSGTNNLAVGAKVTIAGVGVAGYNGVFTVSAIDTTTKFEVTNTTSGLAPSGGGTVAYTGAQDRLNAFFARGGGYIAASASTSNFSFLSASGLVSGTLTQGSQSAYGGIAQWANVGGANSPISGAYPGTDFMFLPSNTTYFTATPTGAVTDGQYPANIATIGPQNGYVSGMWLNRSTTANSAPVLIHGTTTASSRYVAYATNPFSRYDAEREWPLIVQAALWTDQTDK
jgi:Zinc carboxypeptidase